MRVGIVSGYFACGIHEGYCDLFNNVRIEENCKHLIVIVNNDQQTERKYGFVPIDAQKRQSMVGKYPFVTEVFIANDKDESVAKTIEHIVIDVYRELEKDPMCPEPFDIRFYNSGDRNSSNANPKEVEVCQRLGVSMEYLDLPKRGSSSDLIKKIKARGIYEYKEQKHYENIERSIYH